ncbi:hypothetical protein ScPMuIL_014212, partial [Solemya velum]
MDSLIGAGRTCINKFVPQLNPCFFSSQDNSLVGGKEVNLVSVGVKGGSLHHKIVYQVELFKEEVVRWYLFQLLSALVYIHKNDILHRDIKTMNIFTTKTDLLKLGDFGISKVLDPKGGMAQSMVGTPYYMSPEIVKGDRYDYKSDIWALGCVLFEVLTLTKTFQATNPLKLAYEIVKGEQGEIDHLYSIEIRELVNEMLQKEPENRPTAGEILTKIFSKDSRQKMEKQVWELNSATRRAKLQSVASLTETVPIVKSKTSEVYQWGGGKMTPQQQDLFVKWKGALQVSAGQFHFAAVTMEKDLYTWANVQGGNQIVGQLGHGDTAAYKAPKKVDALENVGVIQVSCGDEFTVCVTDEGSVYVFGSDYYGCLGLDNREGDEVVSPVLLNYFSDNPVGEVSCGSAHVVALTKAGEVYTWGSGEFGRLGQGTEEDCPIPRKTRTPGKHLIKHVCAGSDGTFLITMSGRVLACGSNEFNKLGFNSQTSGLRKRKPKVYDIPCKYTFSTVKPLTPYHIISLSAGQTHTAVIDLFGHLYSFGCNKYGQLGVGDFRMRKGISRVRILAGSRVEKVACGDGFTVVSTDENQVCSWGNGENGRLGALFHDQGKGPNSQCTAIPRPIFGSLHVVPCLFARHWNTVLIAEKVLNQKTLKSRVSSPKLMSVISTTPGQDSAFEEGRANEGFNTPPSNSIPGTPDGNLSPEVYSKAVEDSGIPRSSQETEHRPSSPITEESSMPTWLKNEVEEAVFIPIPAHLQKNNDQIPKIPEIIESNAVDQMIEKPDTGQSEVPVELEDFNRFENREELHTQKQFEDKDQLIGELQARIAKLETENSQLKSQLKSQEVKIHSLEQQ